MSLSACVDDDDDDEKYDALIWYSSLFCAHCHLLTLFHEVTFSTLRHLQIVASLYGNLTRLVPSANATGQAL